MHLLARSLAGTTVVFLAASATALAQGENCTHDSLAIDGTATAATFCVAGPPAARVTVTETFARGDKRISRPLTIDVVDGATVTRAVDDVSLADLGSDKQLHLTIAYRGGSAVLEHALLLPGAVVPEVAATSGYRPWLLQRDMACTAVAPGMTPAERSRYVIEHLPPGLFRVPEGEDGAVAWRIASEPFRLAPATLAKIEALGPDLVAFYRALNGLYTRSARGTIPAFLAEYLDQGKPESIVKLARQNRFRADIPQVIRPDLILTDGGFVASELDSVPGGMGFVGAMAHTYCELGLDTVGDNDGMPRAFTAMLEATAQKERPCTAIVVSEESSDYRGELNWLAARIRALGLGDVYVCAPQDIVFTEEALFIRHEDGKEDRIDVLYRNFELFDLLNVPKQELMLYAARHNRVKMTPPPKPQFEEKSAFALLHHPLLEALWRKELTDDVFTRLRALFPQTWILDSRPLPPQSAIMGLTAGGLPVNDWMQLETLGKGDRDYVVKPSGFSELAWGSRGVQIANDLTREDWKAALTNGLAAFEKTPHILQRFHKGRRVRVAYFDPASEGMREMDGRVRLTPYYFVAGDAVRLGGILATVAPADKRLIHGMSDAIMAPCAIAEDGA